MEDDLSPIYLQKQILCNVKSDQSSDQNTLKQDSFSSDGETINEHEGLRQEVSYSEINDQQSSLTPLKQINKEKDNEEYKTNFTDNNNSCQNCMNTSDESDPKSQSSSKIQSQKQKFVSILQLPFNNKSIEQIQSDESEQDDEEEEEDVSQKYDATDEVENLDTDEEEEESSLEEDQEDYSDSEKKFYINNFTIIQKQLELDGYKNFQLINLGTTKVLLAADSQKFGRRVCLKISKEDIEDYEALKCEYKIMKRIQSDSQYNNNIVKILEYIDYEFLKICVVVEELCECSLQEELDQMLSNAQVYTPEQINTIFIHLINSVIQIHNHRIIHFGIKTSNIVKSQEGIYKIGDFNLSTELQQDEEATLQMNRETTKYMSPEQEIWKQKKYNGEQQELTQKSDVFSLAIVFLEILGEKIDDLDAFNLRKGQHTFSKNVSIEWLVKIKQMLAINPEERIDSFYLNRLFFPLSTLSNYNLQTLTEIYKINMKELSFDKKINSLRRLQSNLCLALNINNILFSINEEDFFNKGILKREISEMYYQLGDYQNSLKYSLQSLLHFESIYNRDNVEAEQYIISLLYASDSYELINDYKSSHYIIMKALEVAQNHINSEDHYINGILLLYCCKMERYKGNIQQSLNCVIKAFKLFLKLLDNTNDLFIFCYEQLAQIYEQIGDFRKGQCYRRSAIELANKLYHKNDPKIAVLLNNMGVNLYHKQDFQNSQDCFSLSYSIYNQVFGEKHPQVQVSASGFEFCQKELKLQHTQNQE